MTTLLHIVYSACLDKDGFMIGVTPIPLTDEIETHLDNLGHVLIDKKHYDLFCSKPNTRWKLVDGEMLDAGLSLDVLKSNALVTRRNLLTASDWTAVADADLSESKKIEWKVYRQALRDITEQPDFPKTIAWPTAPQGKS